MESERIRAVTDFTRDIAVDASAGTGKTATLIARVTNLFLAKRELLPDQVLMLTFTEKAAAEMKARVVEGWELLVSACRSCGTVEDAAAAMAAWNTLVRVPEGAYPSLDDIRIRAEEMADGVGRLSVTTFHSFCRRILLSFPAEAGVDPRFEVLPEGESSDAWDAAFRAFLRAEFGREETDPLWDVVLSRSGGQEAVWSVIRRLCLSQRDLLGREPLDFGEPSDFLSYLAREYAGPADWFRAFVGGIADEGHEMTPVFRGALVVLSRAWEAVGRGDLAAACAVAQEGAAAFGFRADKTRSKKSFPQPAGATLAETRDALLSFFRELSEVPRGDAAARFLVERARAALSFYAAAKGSGLDFMDLLLRAGDLLREKPEVAAALSGRFRYVFVDEFQDTDPLQAAMLDAISPKQAPGGPGAGPSTNIGRLFLVGDPKQSIYGFRRADIQVYNRFRADLLAEGGEGITLVRNFRSRPDLIGAINGLFEYVLPGGEDFSPSYAPVVSHRRDSGTGEAATLYALEEGVAEAEFISGLIQRIVGKVAVGGKGGSPEPPTSTDGRVPREATMAECRGGQDDRERREPGRRERPASYRDIAVLYRSDTGGEIVAGYRQALARAGIPHVVSSHRGFYARQEVQDLRMVLAAIDAPADPSALYAALKTIFFGLRDAEILPLYERGGGTASALPGRLEPAAAASPRTAGALALLRRLSARRGRASLSDLLAELYRETGVEFTAARLPDGDRIVQNLAKAAGLARAFEWAAGGSVKAFLADLCRKTEEDRRENEFPSFDEGEDAVQVSTIHSSKGLEFPVVILANLSRGGRKGVEGLRMDRVRGLSAVIFPGFRTYSAFRQVSSSGGSVTFEEWERRKQAAEEVRLLYVAATRARDRLYFVQAARGQGSELSDALARGLSRAGDGGESSCIVTGLPGRRRLFGAEGPGGEGPGGILHVPVAAPLEVADVSPPAALVHPPTAPDLACADECAAPPGEPSPLPPEPVSLKEFHDRERGKRFGDKVHLALEAAPPVAAPWPPAAALPQAVSWEEGEEARWREIARRIGASAFHAELCRTTLVGTEVPLLTCRGGRADEERADLVVRVPRPADAGGDEYWVVDYKTGRRESGEEEKYVRQVRGYLEILSAAWGAPARGFLWYVETGEAVEVI